MKIATDDDLVRDEILHLPLASIDPDPDQPRLDVDADLADSIKQHGVLQAIEVRPHPVDADRWMVVDGERRYQGAKAARLETIPATIKLDVEDAADRIVRQIVRNEGKPLTPVEEALAFKKIIDARVAAGDKKFGVVQLARELGIAKSTIGDRLALTEIPAFWLEPIAHGPLQASQAPLLHKWRKVPEKYQRVAFEQMKKDPRYPGGAEYAKGKKGERIYNRELETLIRTYFPKFVKPVSDVPGYSGPTEAITIETYTGKKTYAMDPSQWGPIWRKGIAARKAKDAKKGKGSSAQRDNNNWQEQERQRRAKQEADEAAWRAAVPIIADQVAAAVNAGAIDAQLEQWLLDGDSDRLFGKDFKALLEKVPTGDSPRELIRYLAFRDILQDVVPTWSGPRDWPKIAKQLGLAPAKAEKRKRGKKAAAPDPAVGEPGASVNARECKYCLCTEDKACELEGGLPCRWYDSSVPVCSNPSCVTSYQEDVESAGADEVEAHATAPAGELEHFDEFEEIEA